MGSPVLRCLRAARFLGRFGPRRFVQELAYRCGNGCCDRLLGVRTDGAVSKAALGIEKPDSIDYVPVGYRALYAMLRKLPVDHAESVFLDFGAGKGRAVVIAATFPFKRVVGVELSERLAETARANVARMRRRRALDVEIHQADATRFRVPDDVNVIHFFNPFIGLDLRSVVGEIRASYERSPRAIHIIFFNDDRFETIVAGETWLEKTYGGVFYPDYTCGLYVTRPRKPREAVQ